MEYTNSKVFKTVQEMFSQRNYKNINVVGNNIYATKGKKKICCYITDINKFNTEKVQEYIKKMKEDDINQSIIVYEEFVTSTAKKNVINLPNNDKVSLRMELFAKKNLSFNITKHILQPRFNILNNKDTLDFKKKYGKTIPVLLTSDPICKFYDYKAGDIIKITNKKNGYVSYRIVKLKI